MSADVNMQEFLGESEELIEQFNKGLLALDEKLRQHKKTDPAILNDMFRAAHSLKGISGMFGFSELTGLSHNLENMLDQLRLGKIQISGMLLDALFEAAEKLRQVVFKKGQGQQISKQEIDQLIKRLERAKEHKEVEAEQDPLKSSGLGQEVLAVLTEYEEHRLRENLKEEMNIFNIRAQFSLDTFDEELSQLQKLCREHGEIITTLPSTEESSDENITFFVILGSEENESRVKESVASQKVSVNLLRPGRIQYEKAKEPSPKTPLRKAEAEEPLEITEGAEPEKEDTLSMRSLTQTVRVDIAKLDNLMNIVGELVLSKNIIAQLVERLRTELGFSEMAIEILKANRNLERKLSELQASVLEVRMVPVGQIFDKLSRNVRKLSREMGKDIDFTAEGGETELDKLIIEDLSDPLMHAIRNAVDHGMEEKAERIRLGKPPRGQIRLKAHQAGNHVVIEIMDDGSGLDFPAIRKKAQSMGLIDESTELKNEDLTEFLFLPGFSTSNKVSEISGRGVGLDVVKSNIASLSGAVDIMSEPGEGTTFRITLPITLAIIQALIIEAGAEIFGIPLNTVQESLAITRDRIQTIEAREVIELRERTLPLLRLDKLFNIPPKPRLVEHEEGEEPEIYIVVVGIAEKRVGLVVDGLQGRQDIVIKPIGEALRGIRGIAGATELGNQKTILILDIVDLIEEASMDLAAQVAHAAR
jgi:two-component system chemotaxis sensor kinase CheA